MLNAMSKTLLAGLTVLTIGAVSAPAASASVKIQQTVIHTDAFGDKSVKQVFFKNDGHGDRAFGVRVSKTDAFGDKVVKGRVVRTDAFGDKTIRKFKVVHHVGI
jgi:hypothetical protein